MSEKTKAKKGKKSSVKKGNGKTGRPLKATTQERRKKILALAKKPVSNLELAKALKVTTAKSQSFARPMVAEGLLKMVKDQDTARVTYQAA